MKYIDRCDELPGRLKEICEGTAVKSSGLKFSLEERESIVATRLGLPKPVSAYTVITPSPSTKMGLGDAVSKALSFVGITEDRVKNWIGEDCKCAERRRKLNVLGEWASNAISSGVHAAAKRLSSIIGETIPPQQSTQLSWSYGITTVPSRVNSLFPQTLNSLVTSGFNQPRIFVDQCSLKQGVSLYERFGLKLTIRDDTKTAGHWVLTAHELYIREPHADRYAIFQDDFVCVHNLKQYLEACPYPDKGYLNLCTYPVNENLAPKNYTGWYTSNQLGKGAQALVFSNQAIKTLLGHTYLVDRFQSATRRHKYIDGGIVEAFRAQGWAEYVHYPTLIKHTGLQSSMGNNKQPTSKSFLGENFDAMRFLQ